MKEVTIYEDFYVEVNDKRTKVIIDNISIYIKNTFVEAIANRVSADKPLIAIILALIEYARYSTSRRNYREIEDDSVIESLSIILQKYQEEDVIWRFKELKYSDIFRICESENPIEIFEEDC